MAEDNKTGIFPKILSYIGMGFCTLFTFMGLIYVTNGNTLLTAFISLIILIALMFLTTRFVNEKTKLRDFKNLVPEFLLGFAYLFVFIIIFPYNFHFIDIDFSRKESIKKAGKDKIDAVSNLIIDYNKEVQNRVDSFDSKIKSPVYWYFYQPRKEDKKIHKDYINDITHNVIAASDYEEYEANTSDSVIVNKLKNRINKQVENQKNNIRKDFDVDGLDTMFSNHYRIKANNVFENWNANRLKIGYYYYDIDNQYKKLYDKMISTMPEIKSKIKDRIEGSNIQIDNAFKSVSDSDFSKFMIILFITLLVHIFVLAEYVAVKRPPYKFKPPKIAEIGLLDFILLQLGLKKQKRKIDDDYNN